MQVLLSKGVEESKILFLSLIAAPAGIHQLCGKYPALKVVTSEIDQGLDETTFQVIPGKILPPNHEINYQAWELFSHAFPPFVATNHLKLKEHGNGKIPWRSRERGPMTSQNRRYLF